MRLPIACTLTAQDAPARMEEWRRALASSVIAVNRSAPGRVELLMADDVVSIGTLVDLARREKACCGFFTFTVEIDARGATLVVEAPDEAIGVLDDFVGLAEQLW